MSIKTLLLSALENEEIRTVSDSFGGAKLPGTRSPSFNIRQIHDELLIGISEFPNDPIAICHRNLEQKSSSTTAKAILLASLRFSFLIELTNLKITSTKMKTRWMLGKITKVEQGSYNNIQGDFSPGHDPRSSSFDTCFEIFEALLSTLCSDSSSLTIDYLSVLAEMSSNSASTRVSYEFVFTYKDSTLNPVHVLSNIRLVSLQNLSWLIKARPIFGTVLPGNSIAKISTKTYKTDRAQTGVDQTNRAKRWEVLSGDFQQASIEDCWAVERELLASLIGFENFPQTTLNQLSTAGLVTAIVSKSYCPITLEAFDFDKFIASSEHGSSSYQVGHLNPLKSGGKHAGENVAWMTDNGNRIQGDYSIATIRKLLKDISIRMIELGI